jgi:hypothetical protein
VGHQYASFRDLVRPTWLLREFRAEPEIATATVLFEDMPPRSGACLGAGAALARPMGKVRIRGKLYFPNGYEVVASGHNSLAR